MGRSTIVIAYILIFVDINLGSINVFPDWVGFAILISAIYKMGKELEEVLLLRKFAIALLCERMVVEIGGIMGITITYMNAIEVIFGLMAVYFHFQFLTDWGKINEQNGEGTADGIYGFRNLVTIATTILWCYEILWNTNMIKF